MSERRETPTFDDILGPASAEVPTFDQVLGKEPPPGMIAGFHDYVMRGLRLPVKIDAPISGPAQDMLISRQSTGRVLDAFGQGARQGWGESVVGLSEESSKWFREAGLFNDYDKGQKSIIKAFNEALIRPSAYALDTGLRSINAIIGATAKTAGQVATELGSDMGPRLERDINLMASEAFAGSPFMFMKGRTPVDIPEARQLGIIGEGEAGWKGTVERQPVPDEIRAETLRRDMEEAAQQGEPTGTTATPETQPGDVVTEPPTIHEMARGLAPETFREYDALDQRRETFRRWIGELDEQRRADAAEPFNTQIAELESKLEGASARNAKAYQKQIDDLASERDRVLGEISGDSPDMARIRQELLKTDFAMRDLAPEVSRAYREAQEAMPPAEMAQPEAAVSPRAEAPEATPVAPEAIAAESAPALAGAPELAPPAAPQIDIRGDVVRQLEALGRQPELAQAEAAIVASHYEARAQRLGTTAQELYAREAPEIRAGRERAKRELEFAQKDKDGITYNQDGEAKTDTPEFKAWFGDSKVVDAEGKPLRVYHGTDADIEAFDRSFSKGGPSKFGFWLTNQEEFAGFFGDKKMPLYVRLDNPKIISLDEWNSIRDKHAKDGKWFEQWRDRLKSEGHDGLVVQGGKDKVGRFEVENPSVYAVFEPEQIKSVFNRGTFDPNDPRILYQGNKVEEVFRGEGPGTGTGNYWTNDKEFARQFTRSGEDKQIKRRYVGQWDIYEAETLPRATNEAEIDAAIATAKEKGYKAIRVDEGSGEPPSVFVFDKTALKMTEHGARDYEQSAKGKIRLMGDGRSIITLFKDADASTFMHETGHLWLDELMRDAKLDYAIQSLKDDAAAVRKWLGAADDAEITRAQHEKFARGFERYLMEGRAPNQELANVFQMFKDWLTAIYQTVQKLRSPINDDIRGVFDRLVAGEKIDKPVLTGEEPPRQSMADRHEAKAKEAKPETAKPEADVIRAETDQIIAELPEEYQNAIRGQDQTGRGEPPRAGAADTGPEGTGRGDDGAAARPGAVEPGREQPAAAGAATLERPAERLRERPEPEGPNDLLPPAETRLLDKAGNIRIDNLNVPEDVAAGIRATAEAHGGFIEARRGVMSDAEVLDLADALGMDASMLDRRQIGQAFNAEEIVAARRLLVKSATELRDIAAKAGSGVEADLRAYAEARDRHRMIQEQVSGITAEAGRALRAFRAMEGMQEAKQIAALLEETTGQTLYQLKREAKLIAKLDTPQKVSRQLEAAKRASYSEMFIEYWINSLFSGPLTHIKNITSNAMTMVNAVVESGGAGVLGGIREMAAGKPIDRVQLPEAKARLYGIFQSAPEAIVSAYKAFKNEEFLETAQTLEQRRRQAIPSKVVEIGRNEIGSEAFNEKLRGMAINTARQEGLKGTELEARAAELQNKPTMEMVEQAQIRTIELGGRQIRTFTRFMAASDEFFKAMSVRQEINAQAVRIAMKEGLEGDALNTRIAQLTMSPTEEMMLAANQTAKYQTFQKELGRAGRAVQQFSNAHPMLKLVVPFVRTPINIVKYNAERSPLGVFAQEVRDNLLGRNGGAARDTQWARLAMGSAVGVTVFRLAMDGSITGGGPTDPREKAILRSTGWKPYSIKIGEQYYTYSWTPLGILMGISADAAQVADTLSKDEAEKIPALLLASISKNLTNQTWLKGPSDLIEAVSDPDRYGQNYIESLLSGIAIPAGVGWLARTDDPYLREANTILEAVKARIPGQSETLLPKRDIWGEPMLRDMPIIQDPVADRLVALRMFPARAPKTIRGVELTPQQYDDFARISGRLMRQRLQAMINQPGFAQLPDFAQREAIRRAVDESREAGRSVIQMQYPNIVAQAIENKTRVLRGEKPVKKQESSP